MQGGHVASADRAAPNRWHQPAAARVVLPLSIDPSQISISGISSGADMTVQVQVAFSSLIMGSGVFAGQPWRCAIHRFGPSDTQYVISLSLKTCEPQQTQQHTLSLKGTLQHAFRHVVAVQLDPQLIQIHRLLSLIKTALSIGTHSVTTIQKSTRAGARATIPRRLSHSAMDVTRE